MKKRRREALVLKILFAFVVLFLLGMTLYPFLTMNTGRGASGDRPTQIGGRADSHRRLRQLNAALRMYATDYDERLPPMTDPVALRLLLAPYLSDVQAWFNPANGNAYAVNAKLSSQSLKNYKKAAGKTITFYEPRPAAGNGGRNVGYLDGQVRWTPEAQWKQTKKAATLP